MSLEGKIEALTEQVTQLTDAVTVLKNVLLTNAKPIGQLCREAGDEMATAALKAMDQEEAARPKLKVESSKSKPTTDTSPLSSNELRTVTYDDVKNVTIAVSKIDKAKAVAGLARFGVTTAKALGQNQWVSYVDYMEEVADGKLDPEAGTENNE